MKHTLLFLAANPLDDVRRALDQEARAIQTELERSGCRDLFELVTRWAVEPFDLLRELRRLEPTVVHFSGRGSAGQAGEPRDGLYFQGSDGKAQLVSTQAIEETFGAAGSSVQVIVLSACYSASQAKALCARVGCVVCMPGGLEDKAARAFAIGFYGGLGERQSVDAAYRQGCAAISLDGSAHADRPVLTVRDGINAGTLVLATAPGPDEDRLDRNGPTGGRAGSPRPRPSVATPDDLLTRLSRLLPSQFEEVLFRARVPTAHLSGTTAPQATRAIDAIRYLDQQNQLPQLARILDQVAAA